MKFFLFWYFSRDLKQVITGHHQSKDHGKSKAPLFLSKEQISVRNLWTPCWRRGVHQQWPVLVYVLCIQSIRCFLKTPPALIWYCGCRNLAFYIERVTGGHFSIGSFDYHIKVVVIAEDFPNWNTKRCGSSKSPSRLDSYIPFNFPRWNLNKFLTNNYVVK